MDPVETNADFIGNECEKVELQTDSDCMVNTQASEDVTIRVVGMNGVESQN